MSILPGHEPAAPATMPALSFRLKLALSMMLLVRDTMGMKRDFFIVVAVGVMASTLPYGYLVAIIIGTLMAYGLPKLRTGFAE